MDRVEHLLTCLAEEAAEVVQATTKALRFGLESSHPGYESGRTNREHIHKELTDLISIVELLEDEGALRHVLEAEPMREKKERVSRFMEHAKRNGCLQ